MPGERGGCGYGRRTVSDQDSLSLSLLILVHSPVSLRVSGSAPGHEYYGRLRVTDAFFVSGHFHLSGSGLGSGCSSR